LNRPEPDLEEFLAAAAPFGIGNVPLRAIIGENSGLPAAFKPLDPIKLAATFGGLLTAPELQSNCIRLEALVHLAVAFGRGHKKPNSGDISRWFSQLGDGLAGRQEDPAEDVFVSNIATPRGNFRVLEGVWESAGFYLQRLVNVIEGMPPGGGYARMRERIYALLGLSDLLCERARLSRYQLGNPSPESSLSGKLANSISSLRRRVRFSLDDLAAQGIAIDHLDPFLFDPKDRARLPNENIGNSTLEHFPLIAWNDEVVFVLPTAASAAIRRFVIEQMTSAGMRDTLAAARAHEYGKIFGKMPLLGGRIGAPIEFRRTEIGLFAGVMTQVDVGRYLDFVFFADTLKDFEQTGLVGFNPEAASAAADEVDKLIDKAYEDARKEPDFRDGLTLLVGCGIGRAAINFLNDNARPNWRVEVASAPDLYTLSWLREFNPLSLWRLLDAQERVEKLGVGLRNINGLLNMVAWARSLDGHLVPHRQLPEDFATGDAQHWLLIEQNSLRDVRHEVAVYWDPHVVQDVQGRWIRVRKDGESVFDEDHRRPLYGSEERPDGGWPLGVYLTQARPWWAAIDVPEETPGHWAYQAWKMLIVWLSKAAPVLEEALPGLAAGPICWRTKFEGRLERFDNDPEPLGFEQAKAEIATEIDAAKRTVTLVLSSRFDAAHFNAENIAERAFVWRAVEAFAKLAGHELSATEHDTLVSRIVPDTAAQQLHAFRTRQFRDYVRTSIPSTPLTIDGDDDAAFRLGLGWRVRKREQGGDIRGKDQCTAYLNALVRVVEDEICADLRQFDRQSIIEFALKNHESAAADRDQWHRTAAAVLSLHQDKEATLEAMAAHEFKLNGAFQASRLLIEFALCESPLTGGRKPGRLDFGRLMAKALFIQHVGGWSDAIRWDVMEPRVHVTALGDILVNHDFLEAVIMPFSRAGSDLRIDHAVKNYAKNLQEPDVTPPGEAKFEPEFLDGWKEQFGASFDETREFLDFIENLATQAGQAVLALPRSKLLDAKLKDEALALESVAALTETLTFKSRASWREVPPGYDERDRHPWRFRRRLAVLRKPLVQIDDGDDPTVIVAPGLVREAVRYMLGNYYRGDYPHWQLTPLMRSWAGTSADRRGREFSNEVAVRLRALGWKAEAEVKITKLLQRGFDRNYGDVDVLAWNPKNGRVLIIECKDVQYRKTFGEIAEQLSNFRGELKRDGSPDDLLRHLGRVELISKHLAELQRYIGLDREPRIESHLVFKNPVPMQFAWKRMAERVSLHLLENLNAI
jgi:hypothetical protein